jgi:hypothetical protein
MVAATHVTGRKAIQMAVLAGADTIEHRDGASEATSDAPTSARWTRLFL